MQRGRRLLSLLLTLALMVSLFAVPVMADDSYSDTHGHWAESSIERWSEYNIVSGSDGAFMPDASMTRGQLAKVLANMLGLTETAANNPFSDVSDTAWYAPYMLRCYAAGIMLGANGKGNPDAPVSRQEAMTMIARALNIEPLDTSTLDGYKDANGVADWAAGYVAALTSAGIVGGVGDSILAPTNDINRASVMKVFDKAISQYINAAGTYTLTDKAGIVLVAAGDVTLTGTTRADVLVSPAADNKAVNFDKATVTGKVIVQADNAKLTASADSKITAPTMNGTGTTYTKTEKPKTSSGSSGGGSYTPPAPSSRTISATGTLNGGTYSSVTISDGVGDGEVTLSGVTVNGNLTINGGGSHSIILDGCTILGKVIFGKATGEAPRMFLKGGTDANEVVVNGNAGAIIEAENSTSTVGAVEANKALEVRGSNTKVETITVPESATATVTVKDAEIKTVEAKGATTVKVDGATIADVKASGATATTIEQVENAANVSTITKVTAASNVTIKTNVETVEVPETATQKVEVTVNGGTVSKIEAKHETEIKKTEGSGTVANVEATAVVSVDQSVVEKVTIPQTAASNVSVAVSGSGSVDVEVNTTQNVEVTGETGSVTVSTKSESGIGAVTVGGQAVAHVHKWNAGVVTTPATCMAEGVKTFTCTDTAYHTGEHANDNTKTEVIAKSSHTLTAHAAVAATCETAGSIAYWTCSECNKLFTSEAALTEVEENGTTIAALGHDWNEWTHDSEHEKHTRTCKRDASHTETQACTWDAGVTAKEPTCTETGIKTFTCTVCNETKTEEIEALGHSYAEEWASDAENHWHVCSRCNAVGEQAAHTFGEWTVTKEATETETGTKEHTCTVCGYKVTEEIPVVVSQKNLPTPNTMTVGLNSQNGLHLAINWLADADKALVDSMSMAYTLANWSPNARNVNGSISTTQFLLPTYYNKLSSTESDIFIKVTTTPTEEAKASGYVNGEKTFTYQVSLQDKPAVDYNETITMTSTKSTETTWNSWKFNATGLKANQWYQLELTYASGTHLKEIQTDSTGAIANYSVTSEYTSCKIYEFSATVDRDNVAITRTPYTNSVSINQGEASEP